MEHNVATYLSAMKIVNANCSSITVTISVWVILLTIGLSYNEYYKESSLYASLKKELQCSPLDSGSDNSKILLIQTDDDGPCWSHCIYTGSFIIITVIQPPKVPPATKYGDKFISTYFSIVCLQAWEWL